MVQQELTRYSIGETNRRKQLRESSRCCDGRIDASQAAVPYPFRNTEEEWTATQQGKNRATPQSCLDDMT
jgi:hypothetical protein